MGWGANAAIGTPRGWMSSSDYHEATGGWTKPSDYREPTNYHKAEPKELTPEQIDAFNREVMEFINGGSMTGLRMRGRSFTKKLTYGTIYGSWKPLDRSAGIELNITHYNINNSRLKAPIHWRAAGHT